jgi:CDP-diacylglycerol--serine O-phosphatidyltransferase
MKHVSVLPNILTLANAGCGLLAISKAIDALASGDDPTRFASLLEMSCWLVLVAGVLDGLDGRIARMTDSFSDFGAQLDSFADAITFGVAPAMVAKVLLERHALVHPRVHFLAAAAFALMAVLRLARFNLESDHDEESHRGFRGLPSPAAAGTIVAMILMFLSLGGGIEVASGEATPVGKGVQYLPEWLRTGLADSLLPAILLALPAIGLLMVSRIPYRHMATYFGGQRTRFQVLVKMVFISGGLYLAPVPVLLGTGTLYIVSGLVTHLRKSNEPKS